MYVEKQAGKDRRLSFRDDTSRNCTERLLDLGYFKFHMLKQIVKKGFLCIVGEGKRSLEKLNRNHMIHLAFQFFLCKTSSAKCSYKGNYWTVPLSLLDWTSFQIMEIWYVSRSLPGNEVRKIGMSLLCRVNHVAYQLRVYFWEKKNMILSEQIAMREISDEIWVLFPAWDSPGWQSILKDLIKLLALIGRKNVTWDDDIL